VRGLFGIAIRLLEHLGKLVIAAPSFIPSYNRLARAAMRFAIIFGFGVIKIKLKKLPLSDKPKRKYTKRPKEEWGTPKYNKLQKSMYESSDRVFESRQRSKYKKKLKSAMIEALVYCSDTKLKQEVVAVIPEHNLLAKGQEPTNKNIPFECAKRKVLRPSPPAPLPLQRRGWG
jgi:hypothetical protein